MNKFKLPELSQEQKDVFQEAFSMDSEYLKALDKNSHPSYDLFIQICKTSSLSILTEEEAQGLLQLNDSSEKQAAILKSVKDKGPKAILTFYLLLNMNKNDIYRELPSSKENDKKLELLSELRNGFLSSLKTGLIHVSEKTGYSGPVKPTASVATVKPFSSAEEKPRDEPESTAGDLVKEESPQVTERSRGKEKGKKEEKTSDSVERPRQKTQRRSWGIRKDDEFFHFIIICFAVGATLISSYNYADWTMSAGIGLIAFASLETIGIYFGLIYRIRTVIEAFLPLIRKTPFAGLPKEQ
ncbi:transmembrane protein 40 [Pelodytes ibericus]